MNISDIKKLVDDANKLREESNLRIKDARDLVKKGESPSYITEVKSSTLEDLKEAAEEIIASMKSNKNSDFDKQLLKKLEESILPIDATKPKKGPSLR